jgi:hypothetical protein
MVNGGFATPADVPIKQSRTDTQQSRRTNNHTKTSAASSASNSHRSKSHHKTSSSSSQNHHNDVAKTAAQLNTNYTHPYFDQQMYSGWMHPAYAWPVPPSSASKDMPMSDAYRPSPWPSMYPTHGMKYYVRHIHALAGGDATAAMAVVDPYCSPFVPSPFMQSATSQSSSATAPPRQLTNGHVAAAVASTGVDGAGGGYAAGFEQWQWQQYPMGIYAYNPMQLAAMQQAHNPYR